ncbi:hypothetical protein [Micromonospora sp. C51]|nr:hypothetical protein [Micromonospora sp. C51]
MDVTASFVAGWLVDLVVGSVDEFGRAADGRAGGSAAGVVGLTR